MLTAPQLPEGLRACRKDTFHGTLYRSVNLDYFASLTSGEGAFKGASRYLPPGVTHALYLATGPDLAMTEATRQYRHEFHTDELPATAIIPVRVDLQDILDLTRTENQTCLNTSLPELIGDWRPVYRSRQKDGTTRVPTQELGVAALEAGFRAVKYPSAYAPDRENYAVFLRDGVLPPSFQLPKDVLAASAYVHRLNQQRPSRRNRGRKAG